MFRFVLNKISKFRLLSILAILCIVGGAIWYANSFNDTKGFSPAAQNTAIAHTKTTVKKSTTPPMNSTTSASTTDNPVKTAKNPTTAPQSTAVASSATTATSSNTNTPPPVISSNPVPQPQPAPSPVPTFHIALQLDQSTTQVLTYPFAPENDPISQYTTPFTITEDPGFTQINPSTMDCKITEEPVGSNMLCLASEKQENTGFLTVQYNNSTPLGEYTVQVNYTIDGVTQSDAMQFDLTSN